MKFSRLWRSVLSFRPTAVRRKVPVRLGLHRLDARITPTVWTVTSVADSGSGTLRNIIENLSSPGDTVNFHASILPAVIELDSEIEIDGSLTINNPNATYGKLDVIITGQHTSRIFFLDDPGTVSIEDVTLNGGYVDGNGESGGIIFSDNGHNLNIVRCDLTGGNAINGDGGCIAMTGGGYLSVQYSVFKHDTVAGNSAKNGGCIYIENASKFEMIGTAVRSSELQQGVEYSGGLGGGICLVSPETVIIDASEVSSNIAWRGGGGLCIVGYVEASSFLIRNSTISDNSIIEQSYDDSEYPGGGGVLLINVDLEVYFRNTTIAFNYADASTTPPGKYYAAGVGVIGDSGGVYLESTILSNNYIYDNWIFDYEFESDGELFAEHSIVGYQQDGYNDLGGNQDITDNSLLLETIGSNGGPTRTCALLEGSPAIAQGSNPDALTYDQRGAPFVREASEPDVGAFERPLESVAPRLSKRVPSQSATSWTAWLAFTHAGSSSSWKSFREFDTRATITDTIRFQDYLRRWA